ncbi:MAG TPA: sigma-70 family RNA polymerase sigma factor [Patescibacteria group bacterium]
MTSLIDRIISGDSKAVGIFYHEYSPKIILYLKSKLPKDEDVQEVLNDVFFEAIDSLGFLEKKQNVSSWLFSIAHNKIVDFYRKQKIKSILLSQMPFLDIVAQEINQPEFQYEKDKIRDKIEKTLKSLSQSHERILRLHYEEKIPVKELALRFNLSFKATESLLFRARKSFKQKYERN